MQAKALGFPAPRLSKMRRRARAAGLPAPAACAAALAYAAVLCVIPWAAVRGEPFLDLSVYLEGFDLGAYEYLDQLEGLAFFVSEPLWRRLINAITIWSGSVAATFQVVSFMVAAVYAYAMLRTHRLSALLLASPLLIDLVLSQVRSAVAGALFFIALLAGNAFLWLAAFAVASLIHTAAVLLFGLFGLALAIHRLARRHPRAGAIVTVGLAIGLPLAIAAAYIGLLSALGDRRAEAEAAWPGGLFVLSFSIYFAALGYDIDRTIRRVLSIFAMLVCGLFIVLATFEINMLRFISLCFPVLVLTAFRLPFVSRLIVLTTLLTMSVYHLVLWL